MVICGEGTQAGAVPPVESSINQLLTSLPTSQWLFQNGRAATQQRAFAVPVPTAQNALLLLPLRPQPQLTLHFFRVPYWTPRLGQVLIKSSHRTAHLPFTALVTAVMLLMGLFNWCVFPQCTVRLLAASHSTLFKRNQSAGI